MNSWLLQVYTNLETCEGQRRKVVPTKCTFEVLRKQDLMAGGKEVFFGGVSRKAVIETLLDFIYTLQSV